MKPVFILLVILVSFGSCKPDCKQPVVPGNNYSSLNVDSLLYEYELSHPMPADTDGSVASSALYIEPGNIECVPNAYRYGDSWSNFFPGTSGNKTYMYRSPETGSEIIDSLPFRSHVNILAEFPGFFLVCSNRSRSGYIKKTDLYLHMCEPNYLFGISHYGTEDDGSCNKSILQVLKTNDENQIIEKYTDTIMGKDYTLDHIYGSALKHANAVFHLYYHCYREIGITADHFIVDHEKLSKLILAESSGDGGYSDISTVYLPVRLTNGKKIVLAKNGQLTLDPETAKPEIYPYPKGCDIPIDELIVVENKSTESAGECNPDGTLACKIMFKQILYYHWDGKTLKMKKNMVIKPWTKEED